MIFTSTLNADDRGYAAMAARMVELAAEQPGFLGLEAARDGLGITVSYWRDLHAIAAWKANAEHREAQRLGHERWYGRLSPAHRQSRTRLRHGLTLINIFAVCAH